ncbi:RnfH family protein [Marinobacterium sp. D7]|uniref:RnfH family protein n=1 Tax=Marinobacterium ramblicola TaxID=2849041 RepID=UPI001C2D88FF|nr:RnfH family protein [Marinobacterium ramblicola]MBV1788500.1 RnfH family protein [Marinobacterium ramblicola]
MKVAVAYSGKQKQEWTQLTLSEDATVEDAIVESGILQRFPEINLKTQKVGVFGKLSKLDTKLSDGDRVEIYRKIIRVMDEDDDEDDDD